MIFAHFIKAFKSMWSGAAAAAAAGPIILWISDLDPPWPPGSATKVTTLFCVVAVILAYALSLTLAEKHIRTNSKHKFIRKQLPNIIGSAFLSIGLLAGIAYLWLYSEVVVTDTIYTQPRNIIVRKVVGYQVRNGINVNATTNNLVLLQDALYDEEKVWTADSLQKARIHLLTTFLLTFFSLTLGSAILASRSVDKSRVRNDERKVNKYGE